MASPRWIFWHLFCLILVVAMIGLGIWQWRVALSPNMPGGPTPWHPRNLVYAVQWWIFAGFTGWFWFRFLRDQRDAEAAAAQAEQDAEHAAPDSVAGPPDQIELPTDPVSDTAAGTER